jgi:acetyl-CoA C-acetyltransferase
MANAWVTWPRRRDEAQPRLQPGARVGAVHHLGARNPAYDLQQACGTGLEAAMLVANKIALGHIESGIAGGVDTTSDAPIGINEKMRKILMEANRAKGTMAQLKVLSQIRPSMLVKPAIPRNGEPRTGLSMGEHAELMAREWSIPARSRTP